MTNLQVGLNILYHKIKIYLAFQYSSAISHTKWQLGPYKQEKIEHYKVLKWTNRNSPQCSLIWFQISHEQILSSSA